MTVCPHFGACGGSLQDLPPADYAAVQNGRGLWNF
jgi:hypothetical protein